MGIAFNSNAIVKSVIGGTIGGTIAASGSVQEIRKIDEALEEIDGALIKLYKLQRYQNNLEIWYLSDIPFVYSIRHTPYIRVSCDGIIYFDAGDIKVAEITQKGIFSDKFKFKFSKDLLNKIQGLQKRLLEDKKYLLKLKESN